MPFHWASDLNPTFALARKLRNRDHRVHYLCIPDTAERIRSQGFDFTPVFSRAFPEGIQPPDGDDKFNESVRLTGFLNGVCGAEFYIANLSAPPPHFRHTGKLDTELAKWIRTRLVSNPTCLLASTLDVFLIIDSQMDYSVIGGPPEVIERFEKRFGGATALREKFDDYVAQMRVGNGIDDLRWAQDYLQKWSGWV